MNDGITLTFTGITDPNDLPIGFLTHLDRLGEYVRVVADLFGRPDWSIAVQLGPSITVTAIPEADAEDDDRE